MVLEEEVEDPEEEEIVEEDVIPEEVITNTKKFLELSMDPYSSASVMALELNITQTLISLVKHMPSLPVNKKTC